MRKYQKGENMKTRADVPFGALLETKTKVDPLIEKSRDTSTITIWTDGNDCRDPNSEEE